MLKQGLLIALLALVAWPAMSAATAEDPPTAQAAVASCNDYDNQAEAQRAKDTRDADGNGIYREDLPCPCLPPDPRAGGDQPAEQEDDAGGSCTKPSGVQRLVFDKDKYPNIRKHFRIAIRKGWPRRFIMNRPGADARRDRLLEDIPTKEGFDRDEYPPAVGRGRGEGLERGRNPRGWKAHVRYVPSSENRSHGAALGGMLAEVLHRNAIPLRLPLTGTGARELRSMATVSRPSRSCRNDHGYSTRELVAGVEAPVAGRAGQRLWRRVETLLSEPTHGRAVRSLAG